jgi:hypothetical protein
MFLQEDFYYGAFCCDKRFWRRFGVTSISASHLLPFSELLGA